MVFVAGNIVCSWGRGEDGQLGHGDAEDRPSPTQLSALDGHDIVSVTCGADHTIAYSESRMEVYSWGWSVLITLLVLLLLFCFENCFCDDNFPFWDAMTKSPCLVFSICLGP